MIFNMLDYCRMLQKNHLSIIYSGPLWAGGVEGIAETLKKRLAFDELPLKSSQAVFSVFVEQMNNMLMYSTEKSSFETSNKNQLETPRGAFVLGVHENIYFLQSGNLMKTEKVEDIRSKIDYLNTLDKKELRQYFKEQIKKENTNPDSRGAGLGLIEIAKRASSRIEYDFTPLEDNMTFFAMYVEI